MTTFFTSIELFAAFFREVVVMVHIVDTLPALAVLGKCLLICYHKLVSLMSSF